MSAPERKYVLISPVRNEGEYLARTIASVAAQTVTPARWVIVDDGSTDDTAEIVRAAASRHPWISLVQRADRGGRKVGGGVIDAFYDGLDTVDLEDYGYLCKLDGDLELPSRYFERLMECFEAEPALGTMSGKTYIDRGDGQRVSERIGDDMSVGAMKFYRVACFEAIGGFQRVASWDGIDCHMCRMNNWLALSKDEPELRVHHMRQMGSSQRSLWTGRKRWGWGKYFMGSHPLFVLAVCVYRSLERPWLVGGLGIAAGYLGAWLRREPRFANSACRRFIRAYELRCLVHGKAKTVSRLHEEILARRAAPVPAEVIA